MCLCRQTAVLYRLAGGDTGVKVYSCRGVRDSWSKTLVVPTKRIFPVTISLLRVSVAYLSVHCTSPSRSFRMLGFENLNIFFMFSKR